MLSVANPPCPSEISALNSDEKGHPSERPSSSPEAADPADGPHQAKQPPFCIRDYVLAYRSEDVGINWPFPQQYLQLFMKHGVRDLLPPFEPPDLVRARFREKFIGVEYPTSFSEVEGSQTEVSDDVEHSFNLPNQESVLGSSRRPHNPLSEDGSVVVQAVGSVQETRSAVSGSSSEVVVAKPPQSAQNSAVLSELSIKKYRLIVKFGSTAEPNRTEGTVSNFTSVSDPMASKVCPVCKTFSSTSNTTLNAHIDQCLFVDSDTKRDTIKLSHHKMKPRKKRSMEDICATAPCCTLEDLDRRNGTNWALDLALMTQNSHALCTAESKQPRISPPKATDDERRGAVYVDSNGTKLLILSKFDDIAQSAPAAEFKNKSSPFGKRKSLPPKYRKYLKDKVQKKKMSSSSDFKGEVQKESNIQLDSYHEEGRVCQVSHAPEQMKVGKPGTLGHWICSKRSSLLKYLNSKSGLSKPMNPLAIARHTSVKSGQSASCDYLTIRGHIQKFHKPSDDTLPPLKIKSTNVLSDNLLASNDQREHLAHSTVKNVLTGNDPSTCNKVTLKVSRSTRNCVSSAKGKKVDVHVKDVQKSVKFQSMRKPSVNYSPQVQKGQKCSRRYSTMDGQHCMKETINYHVVGGQGLVSKKLRKHRFAGKSHSAISKSTLELDEVFCGSRSAHSPGSTSHNVISRMDQSNLPETVMKPETSNILGHVSSDQNDPMDPSQGELDYHASKGGECPTLNNSQHEAECCHAEVTEFDAQNQVPVNMDSVVKCPLEKTIGTCGNKDMTSEDNEATTCDRLDSCLSLEHEREHNSYTEAIIEASILISEGDQGMRQHVLANDVSDQGIWGIIQTELSEKDGYCSELQNIEYQVDGASIQGSSVCLTGHEDRALELSKTSLMASGRTVTTQIHNMMVDGGSSGSPVSASSIVSHVSVEDLKSKDSEREASEEPIIIQENPRTAKNLRILDSVRGTEISNPEKAFQKLNVAMTTWNPQELWDGQPCCCSRRESIPHKYKILRQSAIDGMVFPAKTKQNTSSLYVKPVISSGTYPHSTYEVRAIPTDSHSDSVSVSASSEVTDGFPAVGCSRSASSSSHIQPQSTSSPFLRLMGKDLIVMNNEEPVQQQNQTAPCSSGDTSIEKYMSRLGFSSICSFSNLDSIQCHSQQSLESPALTGQHPSNFQALFPLHAKRMGGSGGPFLQSIVTMEADPPTHHHRLDMNSLAVCKSEKVCTPHERLAPIPVTQSAFPGRDVIVIDDSPEHEDEPGRSIQNPASYLATQFSRSDMRAVRSVSCYPMQKQFQLEGVATWPRTWVSNVMPKSQYQLHQIRKHL